MLHTLLRLAQNLDSCGAILAAAEVDAIVQKIAASPWDDVGVPPAKSTGLSLNQLPSQMRPKSQNPDEDPTQDTIENWEGFEEKAVEQHTLALDKKYLLEDLSAAILAETKLQPAAILNKTLAPEPFIRLDFGDKGTLVLSAHSRGDQHWVETNVWFEGKTNQLKFPLEIRPGGGVDELLLETMAQRISAKLEPTHN